MHCGSSADTRLPSKPNKITEKNISAMPKFIIRFKYGLVAFTNLQKIQRHGKELPVQTKLYTYCLLRNTKSNIEATTANMIPTPDTHVNRMNIQRSI